MSLNIVKYRNFKACIIIAICIFKSMIKDRSGCTAKFSQKRKALASTNLITKLFKM